jgi:hypothetical protein
MTRFLHSFALFVVLSFGALAQTPQTPSPTPKRPAFAAASTDSVYNYISAISLGWRSESKTKKSESQKQVLFRDTTGRYADAFLEAVEDLNHTFGYQKLLPQLSTKDQTKDQAVVLLVGPKSEGRRFLRESGARAATTSGAWDGWFWWDASKEMSKSAIAIYLENATEHSLKYYFRRSLLTALGYPGSIQRMGSIFDVYESRFPNPKDIAVHDPKITPFVSDWDVAILRFCDRFLSTDASRTSIRKIIAREWPGFAAQLDKAADVKSAAK